MATVKFHKVTTLPGTLEADSVYFVQNGAYAETYITNASGTAKSVGNSTMINALATAAANAAVAAMNTIEIVADIAARNTLTAAAATNKLVLVSDATGDSSVASGAALYVFNKTANTTTKIAEYESMDVVLTWAAIQGKPTSAPSLIDDAVTKRHTHANKTVLDALGDTDGSLTYNGNNVSSVWSTNNW